MPIQTLLAEQVAVGVETTLRSLRFCTCLSNVIVINRPWFLFVAPSRKEEKTNDEEQSISTSFLTEQEQQYDC